MKYYHTVFLMTIITFVVGGCGSNISQNSNLNLKVNLHDASAWLNLMPGNNSTFHFRGRLNILNAGKDTVKSLKMPEVEIYLDSTLIYKLKPIFINSENSGDFILPPKAVKHFSFGLPDGIKIKREISGGASVNARFILDSGGGKYIFRINNIKVEKVY